MHLRWLPGGFVGVDIFFVISGYVVLGSVLRRSAPTVTDYLSGFDGYLREPATPGCGPKPKPPAVPVSEPVTFAELGLPAAATSAAVRDVWARVDLADTTGATVNVTVAPMDSAFLVLTPNQGPQGAAPRRA